MDETPPASKPFHSDLRLLIVDDDREICVVLADFLEIRGWQVSVVASMAEAREQSTHSPVDLYLIDKNLPDGNGLDLAEEVTQQDSGVVVMTAYASMESAIDGVRVGITDYLIKPFPNLDVIHTSLLRAAEMLRLRRANRLLIADLERKTSELEAVAVRDSLTGLFNQGFFRESLERELHRSIRHELEVSLILVQLDPFEGISRTYGTQMGDQLLKRFASILTERSRSTDAPFRAPQGDLAARSRVDEIALILPHTDRRGAAVKAEAIRSRTAEARGWEGLVDRATVSVGVATFPGDGEDLHGLIESARAALEAARLAGGDQVMTYSPSLMAASEAKKVDPAELERYSALDHSIEARHFDFHFQPIVHAGGQGTYAFEALVRPSHELLRNPVVLFDTATSVGRIMELGRLVRFAALSNIERLPGGCSFFVNLHPLELNDPKLLDLPPEVEAQRARIVFEITESSAINNFKHVYRRICELRERGYRIAIDDLGSGYAGLLAVSRLTPDFVKLDRALIDRVGSDGPTFRLVRHVIEFASEEGIGVVAEGIENEAQQVMLTELGANLLQGYHLGRPGPRFELGDP